MTRLWLVVALAACSSVHDPDIDVVDGRPLAQALALGVDIIASDDAGRARLVTAVPAHASARMGSGDPAALAHAHVRRIAAVWGLAPGELPDLATRAEVATRSGTIVRLAQQLDGVSVEGAELRVLVQGGAFVAASGTPVSRSIARDAARWPGDEASAIARVAPGAREATARRAWWFAGSALVAAWVVEAYLPDGRALRFANAAVDGRTLAIENLVDHAEYEYRVFADTAGDLRPLDGPVVETTPHPTGAPDGSYPPFVEPALVRVDALNALRDPWLPAGATETVGNNADAYVDLHEPDGLSEGDFRAAAVGNRFDYVYDPTLDATANRTQQQAAIVQLFYTVNHLHDFWYDAGFDEDAGNAQAMNYGRGGAEGDAMRVEAQDRALDGVRNNANMSTPADGMPPRMQMFVFTGVESRTLVVLPSGRVVVTAAARFAAREHDVTAPVIAGMPADACSAITNDVTGKIVLVDATTCPYELVAENVQAAGAVGALIAHHSDGAPPTLGDSPDIMSTIVIPVYSISRDDGATLRAELAAGPVTARMTRSFTPEPDSSLDTLIVAHEFGHFVHRRLQRCTTKLCGAQSEGWGDFLALLYASRAGDNLDGAYPVGAYSTQAFSTDPAYYGVRRLPYSVDRAVDPLTFKHMSDDEPLPATAPISPTFAPNSEVHNAGEIWATVLWDTYVALQKAHPGDHEGIRRRMASYVVASLLLAPPDATPSEMRDALATVAAAVDPADRETILAAFAGRGFGSCAVSPARESVTFEGIVEGYDVRGAVGVALVDVADSLRSCDDDGILDAGERGQIVVPVTNRGHRTLTNVTVTLASSSYVAVATAPLLLAELAPGETVEVTFEVEPVDVFDVPQAAKLEVQIAADNGCADTFTLPVELRVNGDVALEAATLDKFDAPSIWTTQQEPLAAAWRQLRTLQSDGNYDGRWLGEDLGTISDSSLVSPPLVAASGAPLLIGFTHRHDFEYSDDIAWDGGVVEITTDGGATWRDVTELGVEPGYSFVLSDQASNPLSNRRAFAAKNLRYPAFEAVQLDFGTQLAGQTFQIRLRVGSDEAVAAMGWEVDNFDVTGIVGTPFPQQTLDTTPCGESESGGCCGAGGAPGSAGLALGALALISRRRRVAPSTGSDRSREPRRRRA